MKGPVEAKVAASTGAAAVIAAIFGTLSWLAPHLTQPPSWLIGLYVTIATGIAGWLAPHTSRQAAAIYLPQLQPPTTTQPQPARPPATAPPLTSMPPVEVSGQVPTQPTTGATS